MLVENKKAFLSGKLVGTKTLESEINDINNPDEYEKFLIDFVNLKFDINVENEVIYINDNQDFEDNISLIEKSSYASLFVNDGFTRIYVTTDDKKTYAIRINKIDINLLTSLISKEKPIKFSLNAFSLIKWCNEKNIDARNIYDIPTYIKILTNNLDLEKSTSAYIDEYTNLKLEEDDKEKNCIIIGNFIYELGRYLDAYIKKFELVNMCKLINENTYFESIKAKPKGECQIVFSYIDLEKIMNELVQKAMTQYENKAYVLSPLGRIALKYNKNAKDLMIEIYYEDLEMLILNEMYNNNIHTQIIEDNLYKIECKFKNFGNVISLIVAILTDVFYRMFNEKVQIKIESIVKE